MFKAGPPLLGSDELTCRTSDQSPNVDNPICFLCCSMLQNVGIFPTTSSTLCVMNSQNWKSVGSAEYIFLSSLQWFHSLIKKALASVLPQPLQGKVIWNDDHMNVLTRPDSQIALFSFKISVNSILCNQMGLEKTRFEASYFCQQGDQIIANDTEKKRRDPRRKLKPIHCLQH